MEPRAIVEMMYEKDAFSQWLGISVDEVSAGHSVLSMTVRPEMLNGFGIAHGAITYALADSALAFASNSQGRHAVSVDTTINHIAPLHAGDRIVATAGETALKNKVGFYTVEIKNGDTIVALFKGTVFRSEKEWSRN